MLFEIIHIFVTGISFVLGSKECLTLTVGSNICDHFVGPNYWLIPIFVTVLKVVITLLYFNLSRHILIVFHKVMS